MIPDYYPWRWTEQLTGKCDNFLHFRPSIHFSFRRKIHANKLFYCDVCTSGEKGSKGFEDMKDTMEVNEIGRKGLFNDPAGVVVDNLGNMIVADSKNHRLCLFNQSRIFQGIVKVQFFNLFCFLLLLNSCRLSPLSEGPVLLLLTLENCMFCVFMEIQDYSNLNRSCKCCWRIVDEMH